MKHTIESLNAVLEKRNLASYLKVVAVQHDLERVTLLDATYGEYSAPIVAFAPSSTIPPHKLRKHALREENTKKKYLGKTIQGVTVLDVFYGPDRGYKNKSYVVEVRTECGHSSLTTMSCLRHRKKILCASCGRAEHGGRSKVNGVRKQRTSTYNFWMQHKEELPEKYHNDYAAFRRDAGEKPTNSKLKLLEGCPVWVSDKLSDTVEIHLIASAVRGAFRYSTYYKAAIAAARVETPEGVRYQCAKCKELHKLKNVQVDHVDPVEPLDGTSLRRDQIIERIWTANIQVLDRQCHTRKTSEENKLRRQNKVRLMSNN